MPDQPVIPIAALLETIDDIRREIEFDRCEDGSGEAVLAVLDELAALANLAEAPAAEPDQRTPAQKEQDAAIVWHEAFEAAGRNVGMASDALAAWIAATDGRLAAWNRDQEEAGR